MPNVKYLSGKIYFGCDCNIEGEGDVIVDVAEEVVIGNRCTIAGGTYFSGRRVEIGNDFYGYYWKGRPLDIGRGRRDSEDAILKVGNRCTFHDNRIDLARKVTIGDDVGLSPEVVIYTHGYWMSPLDGFPLSYDEVSIGNRVIVGFRSTLLAGAKIGDRCVIGANSLVNKTSEPLPSDWICGGVPVKLIREIEPLPVEEKASICESLVVEYCETLNYRNIHTDAVVHNTFPVIGFDGCSFNVSTGEVEGNETTLTDDFRDFMFRYGIRFYTKRPFRKLPMEHK